MTLAMQPQASWALDTAGKSVPVPDLREGRAPQTRVLCWVGSDLLEVTHGETSGAGGRTPVSWGLVSRVTPRLSPARETNMKVRQAIPVTSELADTSRLAQFDGESPAPGS